MEHTSNKEVAITVTQIKWGKNKDSCPRTEDIDGGGQGTPQEIIVHKRSPNIFDH